jgi:hypothetical protein
VSETDAPRVLCIDAAVIPVLEAASVEGSLRESVIRVSSGEDLVDCVDERSSLDSLYQGLFSYWRSVVVTETDVLHGLVKASLFDGRHVGLASVLESVLDGQVGNGDVSVGNGRKGA